MKTTNYGANLEWDHNADTIFTMTAPATILEDFNSPLWTGATENEKRIRWGRLVRENSQNGKSSLDF